MNKESNRLLGIIEGDTNGPLLVIIGGIHGNEPAGVNALERLFKQLEDDPRADVGGTIIGLKGNVRALAQGVRQVNEDLNRILTPHRIERAFDDTNTKNIENCEIRELIGSIRRYIERYRPSELVVLDLHTTTASGGAFSVASHDPLSESIAQQLGAPLVRGVLNDITGMTLSYFCEENMGLPCVSIIFESGQHDAPESIDRAMKAIIRCSTAIGMSLPKRLIHVTDDEVIETNRSLPKLVEVIHTHYTTENDGFSLKPGFKNFDPVVHNERLGKDNDGEILCPSDGMILMPRYLAQGIEGYFLVKDISCT